MTTPKPVIALVGRPNVGKSTLFNRLTQRRDAIVADYAGLTRDRHYGDTSYGGRESIVVDTGGFEPDKPTGIVAVMARQTQAAVAEADAVIFVVDGRAGVSAQDHDIARYLRAAGKRVWLAVNKAEGMRDAPQLAEFHELGLGEPLAISAAHGQGVRDLMDDLIGAIAPVSADGADGADDGTDGGGTATETADGADAAFAAEAEAADDRPVRLAVVGRPNVGKSTLINTWLGEERLVAFDQPGTTRDAIEVPLERDGRRYTLIDTAGLRRKGKVFEAVEKFSIVKTLQAIDQCNVVVLLLDASQGIGDQDAHIAGYVLEAGRAVVVAINKWDAVDSYAREQVRRQVAQRLAFMQYAEVLPISAAKRQGLSTLWQAIARAHRAAFARMPTPQLTRLVHDAVEHQAPKRAGMFRPKLRYAHQGGMNPPIVVVHGNALEHVAASYRRYLEGRIREHFKLQGTPLRIEMRSSRNPFRDAAG